MEKLTERFVGPYKVKRLISTNAVELELLKMVKIHPVVNVSRIRTYKETLVSCDHVLILDPHIASTSKY